MCVCKGVPMVGMCPFDLYVALSVAPSVMVFLVGDLISQLLLSFVVVVLNC